MSSSGDDINTTHKDIVEDDLADSPVANAQQQQQQPLQSSQTISPSSSHSSLSKQLSINSYKSQSLQSMSRSRDPTSHIDESSQSASTNSNQSNHATTTTNNNSNTILISIVNSEEESDDDLDSHHTTHININNESGAINQNIIKSKSLTQFASYSNTNSNRSINNMSSNIANLNHNQETQCDSSNVNNLEENKQTRSLVILYGESDEENTQTNSYHNSSASNSTSYNSLNNINNNNSNTNNNNNNNNTNSNSSSSNAHSNASSSKSSSNRSILNKRSSVLAQKNIKSTSVGDLNKLASDAIDSELVIGTKITNYKINKLNDYETNSTSSDHEILKEQLNLLKYELKEKDLDIIQLQKEINELLLDNKMLKARLPPVNEELYISVNTDDPNNDYIKELLVVKREKECAIEELIKAQDTISRLRLEKSAKSIDLYDPNNPDILHRKLKTYEKQIQDLEDENERCISEVSKMEKLLDKFKLENTDLKAMVNENRLYKEREEALMLEIANLKNDLKKFIYTNNQLNEENQRLIETLNTRQEQTRGISVCTQTLPIQHKPLPPPPPPQLPHSQDYDYHDDDSNEMMSNRNQSKPNTLQRNASNFKTTQRQTNSPNDYYGHNNMATLSSSSFENDANEPIYSNPRLGSTKSTPATPTPLSINDHHHHHQQQQQQQQQQQPPTSRFSTSQSSSRLISNNQNQPVNGYDNGHYSLSRNDDYLISNFRPFNANNTSNGQNGYYRPSQIIPYMGQLPVQQSTASTTNNSARVYNPINNQSNYTSNANFNHSNSQRTHTNTYSSANTSSYNTNNSTSSNYYRQKELDNAPSMIESRSTTNSSRHTHQNSYTPTPINNQYSRSNTVLNWKMTNGYAEKNEYNSQYDEQDHYSSRRDHTVSSQYHSSRSLCSKAFYSSSETILVDDDNMSNKNDNEITNHDENSNGSNANSNSKNKSLKINVMRDLKSVKKLKSAFTNSKYSKNFASFNEPSTSSHSNANSSSNNNNSNSNNNSNKGLVKSTGNSFHQVADMSESYHAGQDHNSSNINNNNKDSFSSTNLKRSQTFSVPTNSYSKTRSNTTSIIPNTDLDSDFNLTDNLSPTNSQSSFYNDTRSNYNHQDLDIDVDYGRNIYQRSKSADRTGFDRRNKISRETETPFQSSYSKDVLARKRPFVPLKPEDIRQGDFIKFSRPGGKISKGMVKYIGPLPDRSDIYFGLELDSEEGKHDGIYLDKRYFQTKPNKGVFVSFSKVVMAWG